MSTLSRSAWLALVTIASFAAASAQVPRLRDVPATLPAEVTADLVAQHDRLASRRDDLKDRAARHNQRCASVAAGSQEASACEQEQSAIQSLISAYGADVETFNRLLDNPTQLHPRLAASPASAARQFRIEKIEYHGEFYVLTSDGRKLMGQNAALVPIDTGAKIVTGPNSRVQLTLPDDTIFTVGSNADCQLDDFVYDPASRIGRLTATLTKGLFRFVTGKIAGEHSEDMKVIVPQGVIGTRVQTLRRRSRRADPVTSSCFRDSCRSRKPRAPRHSL